MKNTFKSINFKFFIYLLSQRRNFIPILSIFFLTLDNTTANQIGIFTALGFIGQLLFELPGGYISDRFGHRNALCLSKVIQALSVSSYILGAFLPSPYNFYIFSLGAILQSIGFALSSGTIAALYHEILESEGKEKEFAVKFGKIKANVSFVSIFIIIALPFLTELSYLYPLIFGLIFDFIGFFAILFISTPKKDYHLKAKKTIKTLLSDIRVSGLLPIALFLAIIGGVFMADSPYRGPYLVELGYPVIYIGIVMGLSRFVWFILGHNIGILEKYLDFKRLMQLDIVLFSGAFLLISYIDNPYIVGLIFSLILGYKWGRSSLVTSFIIKDYIKDKAYKATLLSVSSQITAIIGIVVTYIKGWLVFLVGYTVSYFLLGCVTLLSLSLIYFYIIKRSKPI